MRTLLAVIVVALVLVSPAAAKHSKAPTVGSSISLVGDPAYGAFVTFAVSTDATNNPFVNLNCYQDGVLVMNSWAAFFSGGTGNDFGLYSPVWRSGGADCQADLGMLDPQDNWVVLASTSFTASP